MAISLKYTFIFWPFRSILLNIGKIYDDLVALRTKLAAGIVDLGVVRTPLVALGVDVTDIRTRLVAAGVDDAAALNRYEHVAANVAGITDGTTDGTLKTAIVCDFRIGGSLYQKAVTDDLWNLAAETDTTGGQYRAYWLYLDAAGTATIAAGTNAASSALAIAALPAVTSTTAVIGVYVAGPSTDFNGAAGLAAQGTITHGYPTVLTLTYANPGALTYAAPAALTASAPAALTAESVTLT